MRRSWLIHCQGGPVARRQRQHRASPVARTKPKHIGQSTTGVCADHLERGHRTEGSPTRCGYPQGGQACQHYRRRALAPCQWRRMRVNAARVLANICIDAAELSTVPWTCAPSRLRRLATWWEFGAAHPNTAYPFAYRRPNRMKVLVHDDIGIWLAARLLLSIPVERDRCSGDVAQYFGERDRRGVARTDPARHAVSILFAKRVMPASRIHMCALLPAEGVRTPTLKTWTITLIETARS